MSSGIIGRHVQWWTTGLTDEPPHLRPVSACAFGRVQESWDSPTGSKRTIKDAVLVTGVVRSFDCQPGLEPYFLVERVDPPMKTTDQTAWFGMVATVACRVMSEPAFNPREPGYQREPEDLRHSSQGVAYRLDRIDAKQDTHGARLTRLESMAGLLRRDDGDEAGAPDLEDVAAKVPAAADPASPLPFTCGWTVYGAMQDLNDNIVHVMVSHPKHGRRMLVVDGSDDA